MAKTIEELKESINNTINQNGTGQITGQGLNILLNEMADVLSTMGGSTEPEPEDKGMNIPIIRCIAPDPYANDEAQEYSMRTASDPNGNNNGFPYVNKDYQEDNIKLFEKLQENNGACPIITVSCEKSYENGGLHYIMNSPALALWYIENPDEDIMYEVMQRMCFYDGLYSDDYIMNLEFINDGPLYIFGFLGDYYGAAFMPCSYSNYQTRHSTNGVGLLLNKTGAYLAYNYSTGGSPA